MTVAQAQDVLRALRSAEHSVGQYEAHLRRAAAVLERSGAQDAQEAVATQAGIAREVADAVYVIQDSLAGWARHQLDVWGQQTTLRQEGDPPF